MSIDRVVGLQSPIIQHGTLFLSNNRSLNTPETNQLIDRLINLNQLATFTERLDLWQENQIRVTEIWLGNVSTLVEEPKDVKFKREFGRPEPDLLLSITPTTQSEILDLNFRNIKSCVEQIGCFEEYKSHYLQHMQNHKDSAMYDRKLIIDLEVAESAISGYESLGMYGTSTRKWYETFLNKDDTLNKRDYEIWELNQPLAELPLFSGVKKMESPYLLRLLDNSNDVTRAANAYLLHFKIPFLRKLREERIVKTISAIKTDVDTFTSVTEPNFEGRKNNKKKNPQITTKQQMILLNALGFLDASIIYNLTTEHKATILSQLLNRSEQEIRCMLTYWDGVNVPKDYDCSKSDDQGIVIDLLLDNNLEI